MYWKRAEVRDVRVVRRGCRRECAGWNWRIVRRCRGVGMSERKDQAAGGVLAERLRVHYPISAGRAVVEHGRRRSGLRTRLRASGVAATSKLRRAG